MGSLKEGATGETSTEKWEAGCFVTFPAQLYDLLAREELNDSLQWSDDGEAVLFHTKNIEEQLLRPFFQGTKMSSFVRKLNRWGFRKAKHPGLSKDNEGRTISYSHPQFKRDRSDLIPQLSTTSNGWQFAEALKKSRAASSSTQDFRGERIQTASDADVEGRTEKSEKILVSSSPAAGQVSRSAFLASMVSPSPREHHGVPFATPPSALHGIVRQAMLQPMFAAPSSFFDAAPQPAVHAPQPQDILFSPAASSSMMSSSVQLRLMEELRRDQIVKNWQLLLADEHLRRGAAESGERSSSVLSQPLRSPLETPTTLAPFYQALLRKYPGNVKDGAT